jgi:steroid 5-alpha reductase family enzyme
VTGLPEVLLLSAAVIAAAMTALWVVSLALRDASIVDIFWGAGFVLVAWVAFAAADGSAGRRWLLVVLTTVWGLRLAVYLAWRNVGKGEDFRYQAMRARAGGRFWIVSLSQVFGLQGALMWLVSLPVQAGMVPGSQIGPLAWVGFAVWMIGLCFETIGDAQLARFKADPANRGRVMDRGLWRYTRHPNYFGDFCIWWGLYIVALDASGTWWTVVGPLVMSTLLIRVSGAALLEKSLTSRREGYADYIRRTSGFFPRPPRG